MLSGSGLFVSLLMMSCATAPKAKPEPKPEIKPVPSPPPVKFVLKDYQQDMKEEMQKSYELADEILIARFSETHEDKQYGLSYYFEDYSSFDKTTLNWGPEMSVIMQVLPHELRPEILSQKEFKNLIKADKVGICWDVYEGNRTIFLLEGEKMLVFLKVEFDEANNRSFRNLLDVYPVTQDCEAKNVFDYMIYNKASLK